MSAALRPIVRLLPSVAVAAGATLVLAYQAGMTLLLLPAGLLLLFIASRWLPDRRALAAAMIVALLAAIVTILRAGHPGTITGREWLALLGLIAVWTAAAVLVASAFRRGRLAGGSAMALAVIVTCLGTAGVRNHVTPVLQYSQYIAMNDGVRLAANVYLPRRAPADARRPAILVQTRYHRAQQFRFPFDLLLGRGPTATPLIDAGVQRGFAYVTVDVRGSGASFGSTGGPHPPAEATDAVAIADWIVAQPWSDGQIGAEGVSYNGSAAERLLGQGHPAVKAIVPMFSLYDGYPEILFPGGIFAENFLTQWARMNAHLDRNRAGELLPPPFSLLLAGVMPVQGEESALARALVEHERNADVLAQGRQLVFRDDRAGHFAPPDTYSLQQTIRAAGAPVLSITGWYDGGYAHAAIKRFLTTPNPGSRLLIGPWTHGGRQVNRKCRGENSPRLQAARRVLPFFEQHLLGTKPGGNAAEAPTVQYYTMCAEQWRETDAWPPPARQATFYFAEQHRLAARPPDAVDAGDLYRVDLAASSGRTSRWASYVNLAGLSIGYPDRRTEDSKLLVYDSAPLESDMEVTGHAIATLHVTSTASDGQFFVYLEDIDEQGHVEYVTEGQLRALHRKLGDGPAPYRSPVPYRSFLRADAQPMQPGEHAELVIDLLPTSYLFRKGHSVRVAIAGADRDNFALPAGEAPTVRVLREAARASHIVLPVVQALSAQSP